MADRIMPQQRMPQHSYAAAARTNTSQAPPGSHGFPVLPQAAPRSYLSVNAVAEAHARAKATGNYVPLQDRR